MIHNAKARIASTIWLALLLSCSGGCYVTAHHLECYRSAASSLFPYKDPVPPPAYRCVRDPYFYGYQATCWRPWPAGWRGCLPCVTEGPVDLNIVGEVETDSQDAAPPAAVPGDDLPVGPGERSPFELSDPMPGDPGYSAPDAPSGPLPVDPSDSAPPAPDDSPPIAPQPPDLKMEPPDLKMEPTDLKILPPPDDGTQGMPPPSENNQQGVESSGTDEDGIMPPKPKDEPPPRDEGPSAEPPISSDSKAPPDPSTLRFGLLPVQQIPTQTMPDSSPQTDQDKRDLPTPAASREGEHQTR